MKKIQDIKSAIFLFEEAAIKHAKATEEGDYKGGNKNYETVKNAAQYLKDNNALYELLPFLKNNHQGLRLAAATFLLPFFESEAVISLNQIASSDDFFSFIAETTLSEWQEGNLILYK